MFEFIWIHISNVMVVFRKLEKERTKTNGEGQPSKPTGLAQHRPNIVPAELARQQPTAGLPPPFSLFFSFLSFTDRWDPYDDASNDVGTNSP